MKLSLIPDEVSHDPFTAFELARKWGIDCCEVRYAYRWRMPFCPPWATDRTVAAVQAYAMTVTGISPGIFKPVMQVDGSYIPVGLDAPDEIDRHIDVYLPSCFAFAERLHTRNITVFALAKPAAATGSALPQAVVDALGRAADKAWTAGFLLLLENGAGTWADTGQAAHAVLAAVGSKHLKLTWDAANVIYGACLENPVTEGYPQVRSCVGNVHVKDAKVMDGKPHWVMLGEGDVDWPAQLRLLRQDNYAGPLTLEPHLQYESPVGLVARVGEFVRRAQALVSTAR